MPYADNAGVQIHYEVEGVGAPLVLQHGFTDTIEAWSEYGYVAALRSKYRLILVDARGHGKSGCPHDAEAYALDRRTADVTAVLDAIGVTKAHFWGYSMGGWIGFGMARYVPDRLGALIIGGQHPYARDQSGFHQLIRTGITEGGDSLVDAFTKMAGPISDAYRARVRAGDLHAWLASVGDRPSMEDMLGGMTMPCCLYAGDADSIYAQAKQASERIPGARFFSVPGLGHVPTFARSELVLPQVTAFLEQAGPLA